MRIAVARETREGESRVALVPELVGKLTGLGYVVAVEPDAGRGALYTDQDYLDAGADGIVGDVVLGQAGVDTFKFRPGDVTDRLFFEPLV